MKGFLYLLFIITISGCVKEDFNKTLDNTFLQPEYSLPVGNLYYSIENDFAGPGSAIPGIYGTDFFNDKPYPVNTNFINKVEIKPFNFNLSQTLNQNIESLTFRVHYSNALPTDIISQVYFLDTNNNIIDSLNHLGKILIPAGITNPDGSLNKVTDILYDFPFTKAQIDNFPYITNYLSQSQINTLKAGNDSVKFYSENSLNVHIGMRIKLKVYINSL